MTDFVAKTHTYPSFVILVPPNRPQVPCNYLPKIAPHPVGKVSARKLTACILTTSTLITYAAPGAAKSNGNGAKRAALIPSARNASTILVLPRTNSATSGKFAGGACLVNH
jgi:hypothetical protein